MDPLICYLCLSQFEASEGGSGTRRARGRCSAGRHALCFHEACMQNMDGCPICDVQNKSAKAATAASSSSSPFSSAMSLLCASAQKQLVQQLSPSTNEGSDENASRRGCSFFCAFLEEIARLSRSPDGQAIAPSLYDARVCEIIFILISRAVADPDMAASAMRAILALAETGYRDPNGRLGTTEGPYRMCRSIECHAGNQAVATAGLDAIAAMIQNDAMILGLFDQASVLPAIFKALKPLYNKVAAMWLPALRALRAVMHHNVDPGNDSCHSACELLMDMMKLSCNDQLPPVDASSPDLPKEIKRYLCQVFADLSVDEVSTRLFFDHKICIYMCILMSKMRGDAGLQLCACRAMANMSIHYPAARVFFGEYFPTLFGRILDLHKGNSVVVQSALRTATALCSGDGAKKNADAISGMVCELMVESLRAEPAPGFAWDAELATEAVRMLSAMAYASPEIAERLQGLGILDALRSCCGRYAADKEPKAVALCEEVAAGIVTIESLNRARQNSFHQTQQQHNAATAAAAAAGAGGTDASSEGVRPPSPDPALINNSGDRPSLVQRPPSEQAPFGSTQQLPRLPSRSSTANQHRHLKDTAKLIRTTMRFTSTRSSEKDASAGSQDGAGASQDNGGAHHRTSTLPGAGTAKLNETTTLLPGATSRISMTSSTTSPTASTMRRQSTLPSRAPLGVRGPNDDDTSNGPGVRDSGVRDSGAKDVGQEGGGGDHSQDSPARSGPPSLSLARTASESNVSHGPPTARSSMVVSTSQRVSLAGPGSTTGDREAGGAMNRMRPVPLNTASNANAEAGTGVGMVPMSARSTRQSSLRLFNVPKEQQLGSPDNAAAGSGPMSSRVPSRPSSIRRMTGSPTGGEVNNNNK